MLYVASFGELNDDAVDDDGDDDVVVFIVAENGETDGKHPASKEYLQSGDSHTLWFSSVACNWAGLTDGPTLH